MKPIQSFKGIGSAIESLEIGRVALEGFVTIANHKFVLWR
jgi:hypothetical protein